MQTELETQVYGFLKNCGGGGLIILNKTIDLELWRWWFKTIECGVVAALAVVVVVAVAVVAVAAVVVVVEFEQ